ncbi:hypothetical protein FNV43_RR20061 [Rhamnella rubrinervis]|uniref:Phytocyanin domain-containing protein n=1 Tax=Rhamnella rubrinervis TaxID=2594499 RepID=A0A8K0GU87_9ROSA|nr:hypothetical protein FNV43_RR20061 [Rhamnella rubrinervis]
MKSSTKLVLFFLLLSSFNLFYVTGKEFQLDWEVPKSRTQQVYNQWASENRFNVNDTLNFKYKKDSVMVVSEEEYEKCHSSHPLYFSNNGDSTVFELDRPGLFFFISGVAGHCQRGQKMIIKVLEHASPSQSQTQNATTKGSSSKKNAAIGMLPISSPAILLLIISVFGFLSL